VRNRRRAGDRADWRLAAEHRRGGGPAALERHMGDVEHFPHAEEILPRQVRCGPAARRGEGQFLRARQLQELRQRLRRKIGVYDYQVGL
jgi:hypothetical protein